MSLSERLASARGNVVAEVSSTPYGGEGTEVRETIDPLGELKRKIHQALLKSLGPKLYEVNTGAEQLEARVKEELPGILAQHPTPLSPAERQRLIADATDLILGYGPLEPLLRDPSVTEIMVNGASTVFVERRGRIFPTDARFIDDAHLRRTIDKIVAQVGRRIDEGQPYVDARLLDGSRVNVAIPPIALDGPVLTIRKFSREPFRAKDLIGFGTLTPGVAQFLEACVKGRTNILVSGGTGAGKTVTLNVLSSFIAPEERIISIEDAAELRLLQPHVVRLEYRPPNVERRGEVTIRDLVRNALRMRPDRIVVGEVRGGEALDMLQAMNTGHDGSISTIHANSPRDALARLETMVLMAGMDLPIRAIREQISSGIQLICHQVRMKDGSRHITHVSEVLGMEGQVITLQDLFVFDYRMGTDEAGHARGHLKSTGLRPHIAEKLEDLGIRLPIDLFEPEAMTKDIRR